MYIVHNYDMSVKHNMIYSLSICYFTAWYLS